MVLRRGCQSVTRALGDGTSVTRMRVVKKEGVVEVVCFIDEENGIYYMNDKRCHIYLEVCPLERFAFFFRL